jgi:alpha-amylase
MKWVRLITLMAILTIILLSCGGKRTPISERIFYEIFVQSFYDTDGDGIGDLNGVTAKLDYLQTLGVNGIWLMPVHPSPTYHKYDVVDYYGIHPDYGTMEDMKKLLSEAHKRNILVIIDMVINHTSSQHYFFREARKGEDNPYRDYYVWSSDSIVLKKEPYHWHKNGSDPEQYYGFFWKDMPDLNFNNPAVREEMIKIADYWLNDVGVDGFRLDAVKYIYPDSLSWKNVDWWKEYRRQLEQGRKEFFLVAEIWDEPDFIGPFLDSAIDAAFNFDLSFAIEDMLVRRRDPGVASLLQGIQKEYMENSGSYHDAIFLKNHDQDRIASLLPDARQARLAASILFTLPGIPFIYYGEEIGMLGMKPDTFIREPFIWDDPGKDPGQTRWIIPRYSTPDKVIPEKRQLADPGSLLSHYRKMIRIRKENNILARGSIKSLENIPGEVCGYALANQDQEILVIHNLTDRQLKLDIGYLKAYGRILYCSGDFSANRDSLILDPFGSMISYRN